MAVKPSKFLMGMFAVVVLGKLVGPWNLLVIMK